MSVDHLTFSAVISNITSVGDAHIDSVLSKEERTSYIEFEGELNGSFQSVNKEDCKPKKATPEDKTTESQDDWENKSK